MAESDSIVLPVGSAGPGGGAGAEGADRAPRDPSADGPVSGAASGAAQAARVAMADDTGAGDADLAIGFDALGLLGGLYSWFVPGLVVGVPGLLLVVIVIANVTLGAAWVPNVGHLLGPAPPDEASDEHLWWAAGRPIAE